MVVKKRKDVLKGETYRVPTECGNFFITFNEQDNTLFEVNMVVGKCGNCQIGLLKLASDQMSKLLQIMDNNELKRWIMKKWIGFSCGNPFFHKGNTYQSCIHWVGQKMLEKIKEEQDEQKKEQTTKKV